MSILKAAGAGQYSGAAVGRIWRADRFFYEYPALPGKGHMIHTYERRRRSPSCISAGNLAQIKIDNDIDEMTGQIWESLNADNRISLYVAYRD